MANKDLRLLPSLVMYQKVWSNLTVLGIFRRKDAYLEDFS